MGEFLLLAFIFLAAGVIAVPIASALKLGSVLGYLLAGVALAPLLGLIGVDVVSIQHFAEFGVVMMLFLVGLELEPRRLWAMRGRLLGLGGLQVGVTGLCVFAITSLFDVHWTTAMAVGMVLALSSTAIILQTLNEKGLLNSDGGQASFSVLLFQDIAVIPMLSILPLLVAPDIAAMMAGDGGHGGAPAPGAYVGEVSPAGGGVEGRGEQGGDGHDSHDAHDAHHGMNLSLVEDLPGWAKALVSLSAVGLVIFGGTVLTRPIFRFIAMAKLRELFTAAALLLVVGIALLMTAVELSAALGTFLAGVVLANSEYRHELESDIEPFKGLLLGLFFITVGASVDFNLLVAQAGVIIPATLGLMALKAGVVFVLAMVFSIGGAHRWLFALALAQAGEFGFVLLSPTVTGSVIPGGLADQLSLIVAISMLLTPVLFIVYDRLIAPRYSGGQASGEGEAPPDKGSVIIAGHGRFGGVVNRMLRAVGFETVVLDYNSNQLDMLRAFGFEVFFGDATRPDLLHAAGIDEAQVLVVAIDDQHHITELVRYVRSHHPQVHVIARAMNRHHVYELYAAGCRDIIRDVFDSSVRTGRSAFEALGVHPFEAERLAQQFVTADRQAMVDLAELYDPDIPAHENGPYVARVKQINAEREAQMKRSVGRRDAGLDRAWTPPGSRDVEVEGEGSG